MNILVDAMPTTLIVDGQEHEIITDYRYGLCVILADEDKELATVEKGAIMLSNLFKVIPQNIEAAFEQCQYFMSGGVEQESGRLGPKLYSFSQDAQLIFAAFKHTHNIDLQEEDMHWWKFLAYFADLGQDTTFCQLVSLRSRDHAGTLTKEERTAVRKMGKSFRIDQTDSRSLKDMETIAKVKADYKAAKARRDGK